MDHLEIRNATFTYPERKNPSLSNITVKIPMGSFTLLCGTSGCGKTTLLRMLKPEIRPHGQLAGNILYQGEELNEKHSREIGFIFQDVDHQIVMEEVQYELSFGMENIGLDSSTMKKRLAEIVQFFDLEFILHKKTDQLSGGEKQLLNLASVLLMKPTVIILDEPTAQLDPISSKQLLQMLKRLNEEWGITIILVEHRLDELFSMVDYVVFLESGQIQFEGNPQEVVQWLWKDKKESSFIPMVPRMVLSWDKDTKTKELPLSIKEGRNWWTSQDRSIVIPSKVSSIQEVDTKLLLELKELTFRYLYEEKDILTYLRLEVKEKEALAILGRNGSGKSTLLQIIVANLLPQRGKVRWHKKVQTAFLPQNPKSLFSDDELGKEMDALCSLYSTTQEERNEISEKLEVIHLLHRHPHDLSGGELQRAALALLLCTKPKLLLLDEPTKGLDPVAKKNLIQFLKGLHQQGMTLVFVTHDLEFAVQFATRCALLFQGEIASVHSVRSFFKDSFFYTTILQRVLSGTSLSHITSWEEFIALCPGPSMHS